MDDSLFIRELGIKSPMLKVLDFFMDNRSEQATPKLI